MATNAQFMQFGPFFQGGLLLTNAKLYHYAAGTTSLKNVWTDRAKSTTAAQPLLSDSNGIFTCYADGVYKFVLTDANDVVISTWDNWNAAEGELIGEGAQLTAASTLILGSDGNYFHVTGSTTIEQLSGTQPVVTLTFDSALTLMHSSNIMLSEGLDFPVLPGTTMTFINDGSNVWREVSRSVQFYQLDNNGFRNLALSASVDTNALTIALKGKNGQDPSSSNPVDLVFRDPTLSNGGYTVDRITSAVSMVLSAGSSFGAGSNETIRGYVYAVRTGTNTVVLGVTRQAIFEESQLHTTTAEGGAGAADATDILYTTSAQTSKPVKLIGVFEITSGATPGNWTAVPTMLSVWRPGMRKTNDVVKTLFVEDPTEDSTTGTIAVDNSIPQSGEGKEYRASDVITPTNAINRITVEGIFNCAAAADGVQIVLALFKNSETNATKAVHGSVSGAGGQGVQLQIKHSEIPGSVSAITWRWRFGVVSSTGYINRNSTADIFDETLLTHLRYTEVYV